jgi:hypothetical protein
MVRDIDPGPCDRQPQQVCAAPDRGEDIQWRAEAAISKGPAGATETKPEGVRSSRTSRQKVQLAAMSSSGGMGLERM